MIAEAPAEVESPFAAALKKKMDGGLKKVDVKEVELDKASIQAEGDAGGLAALLGAAMDQRRGALATDNAADGDDDDWSDDDW